MSRGRPTADNKFGLARSGCPKLTKEQLAKIKADNKKIAGLNSLINEAQNARQAQDWPKAENALKQLIAAAPETSRWDFYMALGEAQSKSNKPGSGTNLRKGSTGSAVADLRFYSGRSEKSQRIRPAAGKERVRMLTSQGNDYLKLQKPDEAIASLKKAAEVDPSSALGQI